MRARAIREGSVGLLILVSIALFGILVLWLRGLSPGKRAYTIILVFENALGMQEGNPVLYRGVSVGRVLGIAPETNQVRVLAEITDPTLRMPRSVMVTVNQSGLIGDTTIDITPLAVLSDTELQQDPLAADCDDEVIVCDGTVLSGKVGASYEALLRSAEKLADTFSDPEIVNNLKATLENATAFTDKAIVLSEELTQLTEAVQKEIGPLAASAKRATDNAGNAAAQIELTAAEVSGLIATNRSNINSTLVNINHSSDRLLTIMDTLAPAIQDSELIQNLEILSANAVAASANIRDITGALNTQENLVMLQQTLDSARNVFQSAQKILADVDELTGDPAFRNNLRNLVNGLSNLVSTTEFLEQQVTLAQLLAPAPGQPAAQVSLTALPAIAGQPVVMTGNPVLLSHNGQLYQLNFAQSSPAPPAP